MHACHCSNCNTSLQALMLLYQASTAQLCNTAGRDAESQLSSCPAAITPTASLVESSPVQSATALPVIACRPTSHVIGGHEPWFPATRHQPYNVKPTTHSSSNDNASIASPTCSLFLSLMPKVMLHLTPSSQHPAGKCMHHLPSGLLHTALLKARDPRPYVWTDT